jgi:hypothetical protein
MFGTSSIHVPDVTMVVPFLAVQGQPDTPAHSTPCPTQSLPQKVVSQDAYAKYNVVSKYVDG